MRKIPMEKGAKAALFLIMEGRENQRSGINSSGSSKQLSTKRLVLVAAWEKLLIGKLASSKSIQGS